MKLTFGIVIFLLPIALLGQTRNADVVIGKSYSIRSEVLGEQRNYAVYLPKGYDSKTAHPKPYPVIYLLDGEAHFHSVSGILDSKSSGINAAFSLPEMILVAIGNTDRERDLAPTRIDSVDGAPHSGSSPAFLRFLKEELFVHIERTYRTMPYRILIGHSLGGLLAIHAMCAEPDMFDAYIAIDPTLWWEDRLYVRKLEALSRMDFHRKTLFLAEANHPHLGDTVVHPAREYAEKLNEHKHQSLNWKHRYYENETHGTVPLIATYDGLHFIFDGYDLPLQLNPSPAEVEAHFKKFSGKIGFSFPPPEMMIVLLGYNSMSAKDYEKAVQYYQLAVDHYPESYVNHRNLGDAWLRTGDSQKALTLYKKSLKLNPSAAEVKRRIAKIENGL